MLGGGPTELLRAHDPQVHSHPNGRKGRTVHEIAAYGGHRSLRMAYLHDESQPRGAAKAFEDDSRTEMSTVPVEGYTKERKA